MRHPEIPVQLLFGVAPLLVADDGEAEAVNPADAGDERRVVSECPVAVQFGKVGYDSFDVVKGIGPPRMTRKQNALPGCQVGVELRLLLLDLLLEPLDLVLRANRRKFIHPRDQVGQRLLEIEPAFSHPTAPRKGRHNGPPETGRLGSEP